MQIILLHELWEVFNSSSSSNLPHEVKLVTAIGNGRKSDLQAKFATEKGGAEKAIPMLTFSSYITRQQDWEAFLMVRITVNTIE